MDARILVVALLAAAVGTQAADTRPNILLLFPDQWRYDWDGLTTLSSGQPLPLVLPTVRAVAESGTRFTQATVPSPLCAPSRGCLASAREYDAANMPDNFSHDYPINQTTFYTLLRDQGGYWTMTTGKDDLTKASQLGSRTGYPNCSRCRLGDGLYHQAELGFSDGLRYSGKEDVVDTPAPHEMYGVFLNNITFGSVASAAAAHGHRVQPAFHSHISQNNIHNNNAAVTAWDAHRACMGKGKAALCNSKYFYDAVVEDDFTAVNAITLLRRRPQDRPFFLQVSFPSPHSPFLTSANQLNKAAGMDWPSAVDDKHNVTPGGRCAATTQPSNEARRCNYAAELLNLDMLFAQIISEVQAQTRNSSRPTYICISSDHGELLGDHGDTGKSKPWQGAASVPLLCSGPGIRPNASIDLPVTTLDLAGTFLDWAGVQPAPGMTSTSLRPLLERGPSAAAAGNAYRDFVASGLQSWRMVVSRIGDTNYKLVCCQGACPGAPSTAPAQQHGHTLMLIDTLRDPFDMHDLTAAQPAVVAQMLPMLPEGSFRSGCSTAWHARN